MKKKFDTDEEFDRWSERMRQQEIVGHYFGEEKREVEDEKRTVV